MEIESFSQSYSYSSSIGSTTSETASETPNKPNESTDNNESSPPPNTKGKLVDVRA